MTDNIKTLAQHLSLCRYAPSTKAKRFAQFLAYAVKNDVDLTEKQISYMYRLACYKRQQLPLTVFYLVPQEIWVQHIKKHKSLVGKNPNLKH